MNGSAGLGTKSVLGSVRLPTVWDQQSWVRKCCVGLGDTALVWARIFNALFGGFLRQTSAGQGSDVLGLAGLGTASWAGLGELGWAGSNRKLTYRRASDCLGGAGLGYSGFVSARRGRQCCVRLGDHGLVSDGLGWASLGSSGLDGARLGSVGQDMAGLGKSGHGE
jgi:hypothetical protein